MEKSTLSVILPCAGDGRRLGLSYAKELHEVDPGVVLIDYSLDHIRAFTCCGDASRRVALKVVVVIKPGKESVVDHVQQKLPDIAVSRCYFNERYQEWPGSVYSAEPEWSDLNLVLLPDSYLMMSRDSMGIGTDGKTLVEASISRLSRYPVMFGVIPCTDPNVLSRLGALTLSDQFEIDDFQDKPAECLQRFNAYWCCYGFRRSAGAELYQFLIRSVRHESPSWKDQLFMPVGAFPAHRYFDLGERSSIRFFQRFLKKRF